MSCKSAKVVSDKGDENGQLWGHEVKGQGYAMSKLDLAAWWRHQS